MTEEQIREIEHGCEGVTKGPWQIEHPMDDVAFVVRDETGQVYDWKHVAQIGLDPADQYDTPTETAKANAAHIARLDPDTVRELCQLALKGLKGGK